MLLTCKSFIASTNGKKNKSPKSNKTYAYTETAFGGKLPGYFFRKISQLLWPIFAPVLIIPTGVRSPGIALASPCRVCSKLDVCPLAPRWLGYAHGTFPRRVSGVSAPRQRITSERHERRSQARRLRSTSNPQLNLDP